MCSITCLKYVQASETAFGLIEGETDVLYGRIANPDVLNFKGSSESSGVFMTLVADDVYGCDGGAPIASNSILVVRRGNCTFQNKTKIAESRGAAGIFIINEIDSLFNSSGFLLNPCSVNCDTSKCSSDLFTSNPRDGSGSCCVLDNSLSISINDENYTCTIPVVGFGFNEALDIWASIGKNAKIFEKDDTIYFDGSSVILVLLGSLVAIGASYRASRTERMMLASRDSAQVGPIHGDEDLETQDMSMATGVCFLVCSSAGLIGLFFLVKEFPQQVVIALQIMFGISATFAFSQFALQPLFRLCVPPKITERSVYIKSLRKDSFGTVAYIVCTLGSLTLVIVWLVYRHSSFSWVILDMLAASVCVLFLCTLRFPSLQAASFILFLFFVYDIFMVFITPSLFSGESVMVEVARAGSSVATTSYDNLVCERTEAERMPMLFLVPRFSDSDQYSLLGLGDVFLPGLILTLACRIDYIKIRSQGYTRATIATMVYFTSTSIAYILGLSSAFLANIFQLNFSTKVQGQPALLYLVPFTVFTFIGVSLYRGDFHDLWNLSVEEVEKKWNSGCDDEESSSAHSETALNTRSTN